ncbi:hypothetical protein DXG03_008845 [Asterophora parasitica]|uniref:Uncharacterized protein n=1 Tax=Asterophora parasitica TaxID=117018 RepID=A0A9P7FYH7_9AGAR|nr:hypothetical protein DXG03_008845 [Asterophora parasitica]
MSNEDQHIPFAACIRRRPRWPLAAAHIRALTGPPTSTVVRKRILLSSLHGFKDIIGLLDEQRPELKDRLNREAPPTYPFDRAPIDFARIEEVLSFKKDLDWDLTKLDSN